MVSREHCWRQAKPGDVIKHGAVVFEVSEVADGHVWGRVLGLLPGECCRICGMMRRKDRANGPCCGASEITLRGSD